MRIVLLVLAALTLSACQNATQAEPSPIATDPWVLSWGDPTTETPVLLWNGLIGLRIARDGTGTDADGQPLPFFKADRYDLTGEEKIARLPSPFAVRFEFDGAPIAWNQVRDYRQALDMRTGILETEFRVPVGKGEVRVASRTSIHPEVMAASQVWTFETSEPLNFRARLDSKLRDVLGSAEISQSVELGTDHPSVGPVECTGRLQPDLPGTLTLVARFGPNPEREAMFAFRAARRKPPDSMPKTTAAEIEERSRDVWAERWKTDIEIEGPVEDQAAIRSFLFYLRSAIHPDGFMGVAPFGLSDETYGGHVFWDADVWIFPALALIDPEAARSIPDYRIAVAPAAVPNLGEQASVEMLEMLVESGRAALQYPWQSSVSGMETAPPEEQQQIHVTGSVLWGLELAAELGIVLQAEVDEIGAMAAEFYLARALGPLAELQLDTVMSPDEYHIGDNDLYTNLLAEWVVRRYARPPRESVAFRRPRDETSLLTYDQDPVRGYKQAAAVLAIYPLQDSEAEQQATVMLDRFVDKVVLNGPAMSHSVHATIFARIGKADQAYDAWRKGWMEYANHPLMLFSEKRTRATAYFATGAAGCLQTVIFGFLGFRIDNRPLEGAAWTTPLASGASLSVRPRLPKAWKSVRFKNFTVLGKRYDLVATHDSAKVTQGDP